MTCTACGRATACFHCERDRGLRFAVWSQKLKQWLVDTCAGGAWSPRIWDAVEYATSAEVHDACVRLGDEQLDRLELVVVSI